MDLLKDNLKKLYFKFLIPSLGSAMVMSIYTLTDAIVIGKGVGADALAALSITTPLLCIIISRDNRLDRLTDSGKQGVEQDYTV